MSHKPKSEVVGTMKESGLVPVFSHPDPEICKGVIKACYEGGLLVFEFTNRAQFAPEVFASLSKYVQKELPGMLLGAGSVIDEPTAAIYMQMGAKFIVSPGLVPEMAKICHRRNIMWIPGCATVSEILKAMDLGADIVKIFPAAQVGGPSFVKAVLGPIPWVSIMPTGGVAPEMNNLEAWFSSGVDCVGMGSKLFPKTLVDQKNFDEISVIVKNTLAMIKEIRQP